MRKADLRGKRRRLSVGGKGRKSFASWAFGVGESRELGGGEKEGPWRGATRPVTLSTAVSEKIQTQRKKQSQIFRGD